MNPIRIIGIIGIVIIATVFLLSIPEEPDDAKIQRISDVIGVSPEDIVNDAKAQLIVQNIFSEEPDYVIDEVEFYVDEITEIPKAKPFELVRTITFDDGTFQKDVIEASSLEQLNLSALDFIALKNDERPLNNGNINLKLLVNVDKDIERAEGEFVVFFGSNKDTVKIIMPRLTQANVVDSNLIIFDQNIQLSNLLASKNEGIHQLELRMDKFFIIFNDNSREFANPLQVLYTMDFEKNISKSIVKSEEGKNIKIFDFDVPITISANSQKVSSSFCLASCRGGGCCMSYGQETVIPAPALGSVTITDKTGKIVAEKPAMSGGSCTKENSRVLSGTNCLEATGGGGSLSFNAQRGESYQITVSDPSKSWIVNVPESGGSFYYSCYTSQSYSNKDLVNYQGQTYTVTLGTSSARICNLG